MKKLVDFLKSRFAEEVPLYKLFKGRFFYFEEKVFQITELVDLNSKKQELNLTCWGIEVFPNKGERNCYFRLEAGSYLFEDLALARVIGLLGVTDAE